MAILLLESMAHNKSKVMKNAVKALELIVLSTGLITILVMVKGAIVMPYSCELVFSSLLGFWNSIRCLLSSNLYICMIINSMIILIAISSSFHRRADNENLDDHYTSPTIEHYHHDVPTIKPSPPPPPAPPPTQPSPPPRDILEAVKAAPSPPPRDIPEVVKAAPSPAATAATTTIERYVGNTSSKISSQDYSPQKSYHNKLEKLSNISTSTITSKTNEIKKTLANSSPKLSMKEKMVTSSIIHSPKRGKEASFENEDKRANNPSNEYEKEDDDSLEAMWKAIKGEVKEKPKRKQLKKSETWEVVPPRRRGAVQRLDSEEVVPSSPKWKELRKSETFNDAISLTLRGGLIRRDPSMSLDQLNKRFEAFIKNFNHNMRLQRQESDQRLLEMIRKGL